MFEKSVVKENKPRVLKLYISILIRWYSMASGWQMWGYSECL